jgi:hypothetical protein
VYDQTKRFDITNIKCKHLIGAELTKIMERKHLGKLNKSMGVFLQGVKELMDPYVEELEEQSRRQQSVDISAIQRSVNVSGRQSMGKSHVSSFLQRNRTRDETEESVDVPSFGDDESLTSKMPVHELQTIYRQIAQGTYRQPDIVGTARQVQAMDRVTAKLTARSEQAAMQKRDASLMRVRRDVDRSLQGPLSERIAPSAKTAFKRIVGTSKNIESIDVTDEILKALDSVLEHCEDLDMKICVVLMQGDRSELRFENPIRKAISRLLTQIHMVLFKNDNRMMRKINALYRHFDRIDSQALIEQLGNVQFTADECNRMLDNPFSVQAQDAATRAALEFIKDLRHLEQTFVKKILNGEIQGNVEAIEMGHDTPSDSIYLDTTKARKVLARLGTIKINQPVRVVRGMTEIPDNLIERDILYVACQLAQRSTFGDDSGEDEFDELFETNHMDYVSKFTLSIARSFQEGKLNEHDALRVIRQIIFLMPCIPQSFLQTFVYHVDNEYFQAIRFENPALNATWRRNKLAQYYEICPNDSLLVYLEQNLLVNKVEAFMRCFDNDFATLANTINAAERRAQIVGQEIANNGSGVLGLPAAVDVGDALEGDYNNLQLGLVSEQIPQGDVASADIEGELVKIDGLLKKQDDEGDHLDSSKIAKIALRYELQPSAVKRKNYFQSRGSELPKWFPGFYNVFSDSYRSRPVLYSSPYQMLSHAWRSMAPIVSR